MSTGRNWEAIIHEPRIRERPCLGVACCFRTMDKGTCSMSATPSLKHYTVQVSL